MKHSIPLGTRVAFVGDSHIYVVDNYQELLYCDKNCTMDHDCYLEPYINVRVQHWTAKPLSQLKTVFSQQGIGYPYDKETKA